VDSWTPARIYTSEELVKDILGKNTGIQDERVLFRDFYAKVMKVLKMLQPKNMTSGRGMENLAWVKYHLRKKSKTWERLVCGECGTFMTSQNQKQKQGKKEDPLQNQIQGHE